MEEIVDLIATDASPSDIAGAIKNALFVKSSEKIEALRPYIATSIFGEEGPIEDQE
jgi:hypothetical protein